MSDKLDEDKPLSTVDEAMKDPKRALRILQDCYDMAVEEVGLANKEIESQQKKIEELEKALDGMVNSTEGDEAFTAIVKMAVSSYEEENDNLTSRITKLEEKLTGAQYKLGHYYNLCLNENNDTDSLQSRLEICESALEEYGSHKFICTYHDHSRICNCGYDALVPNSIKPEQELE